MNSSLLTIPGVHSLFLSGQVGRLETELMIPDKNKKANQFHYLVFIGHPHSLYGGTMNNKVVTTMARACKEMGMPSLRFNFRGVGQSEGIYDAGIGESEDMLLIAKQWLTAQPNLKLIFTGFSFGSYVAYRAAAQCDHALLITVAPAIPHFNYHEFVPRPPDWIILQGEQDEVISADKVYEFAQAIQPSIPVIKFANTGHFFHGRLMELKSQLMSIFQNQAFSA